MSSFFTSLEINVVIFFNTDARFGRNLRKAVVNNECFLLVKYYVVPLEVIVSDMESVQMLNCLANTRSLALRQLAASFMATCKTKET